MAKSKEDAVKLLQHLYEIQSKLAMPCSEFNFETEEERHVYSKTIGNILNRLLTDIYLPIYKKYPELIPIELSDVVKQSQQLRDDK